MLIAIAVYSYFKMNDGEKHNSPSKLRMSDVRRTSTAANDDGRPEYPNSDRSRKTTPRAKPTTVDRISGNVLAEAGLATNVAPSLQAILDEEFRNTEAMLLSRLVTVPNESTGADAKAVFVIKGDPEISALAFERIRLGFADAVGEDAADKLMRTFKPNLKLAGMGMWNLEITVSLPDHNSRKESIGPYKIIMTDPQSGITKATVTASPSALSDLLGTSIEKAISTNVKSSSN